MLLPTFLKSWLRGWLLSIVAALVFALAGCGGRSDEDAYSPRLPDAASDSGDGAADARDDADDTSDTSVDAPDALDASIDRDAAFDVSVDADASRDADADAPRVDAPIDGRLDVVAPDASDGSTRTLVSIAIAPPEATLTPGTRLSLTVTGTYSDMTTADLTATAAFTSVAPTIASIANNVVTAVSPGISAITARVGGLLGTATITVSSTTVVSIAITPATPAAAVGGTVAFAAVATLSDGNHQDVTASATWSTSDPSIATVSQSGLGRAVGAGVATIRAAVGMIAGAATFTVSASPLVSIAVTPTSPSAPVQVTLPFTATATFADGSIADVTATATWASSSTDTLTISAGGVAKTLAPGTSIVSATVGTITGTTTVTVTPATVLSIEVTPASSVLALGGTAELTATGHYSDMSSVDLTSSVTWSSNAPTVVSVSNASGSNGSVSALAAGMASITASLGAVRGTALVSVTTAKLVTIDVNPTGATIPIGTSLSFRAQGTYADGTTIDITDSVTWSIADATIASVSNAPGSSGEVTGTMAGSTLVRAFLDGVTGSTMFAVSSANLVSIAVTPAGSTLVVGQRQAMKATGTFSDMTTVDLTANAVWKTADANIATVSNAAGAQGQLTAVAAGTTMVSATFAGVVGTTPVTITAPALSQLVIAPIDPSNRVGQTRQFTATAIFSNGTQQNVTARAMWSSSNAFVATINRTGLATAVSVGSTTISAAFQGLMGATTLTVTSAVPVSITVTPFAATISAGSTLAFQAVAIFSDNTTQNVTNQATWVSTSPMVAAIGTAGPMRAVGRGLSPGTTTIQATWQGLTGSTQLTVTDAVPVSISVSPVSVTVTVGKVVPFTAAVIYSDGSSRTVTGQATWTSTDPSVAAVTTGMGNRGQATALAPGKATIQASFSGLTGTASIAVTSATLSRIQVTPFTPTLPLGFITQFVATGVYTDDSTQDLTADVTWVSSAPSVAGVSNAGPQKGQVTPITTGATIVSATLQTITGSTTVTVVNLALIGIVVTPADAMIAAQGSIQYVATGSFPDGSTLDITKYVTWSSTDNSIADVSNATGSQGLAKGFSPGVVTISASRGSTLGMTKLSVE